MFVATKVIIPKQGLQMTDGKILKWLVNEGEKVEEGKPLFEMETDKLNIEIEAPVSGILLKILRDCGETVPVTETIGIIGKPGEDISDLLTEHSFKVDYGNLNQSNDFSSFKSKIEQKNMVNEEIVDRVFITPRARSFAAEKCIDFKSIKGTGPEGLIIERDIKETVFKLEVEPKSTPLAKKISDLNSIKLDDIKGTGPKGKVMKADVEEFLKSRKSKEPQELNGHSIPFSGTRKVISDKMMQSLHEMAQANHRIKVDVSEVIRLKEKLKTEDIKVSITDIIIKVVSNALIKYPILNSSLLGEEIILKNYINIGIAVAIENGLIVPVIKNVNSMTLSEVSRISTELITKAKNNKLTLDEYTGGTFTISNLGMFDIDEFTAIINPPEAGILALGKIERVPVVENDNIVIKPIMMMSLTYDHRIVDGVPAAQFLQEIKKIIKNPYLLI